jgi:hypothetical protein
MHRTALASVAAATIAIGGAVLGVASPASAASNDSGWFQVVESPYDEPAGVECDFPFHAEPIVNQVFGKTTRALSDGTPTQQIFTGPLVYRITNTDSGTYYDANASGSAVVDYGTDGSQTWHVIGPILLDSFSGKTNLPRGLWVINGIYTIEIDASHFVTVTLTIGTEDNVCNHLA